MTMSSVDTSIWPSPGVNPGMVTPTDGYGQRGLATKLGC
jgi:hypothetical protein